MDLITESTACAECTEDAEHIRDADEPVPVDVPETEGTWILKAGTVVHEGVLIVVHGIQISASGRPGVGPVAVLRRKGARAVVEGGSGIIIAGKWVGASSVFDDHTRTILSGGHASREGRFSTILAGDPIASAHGVDDSRARNCGVDLIGIDSGLGGRAGRQKQKRRQQEGAPAST